MLHFGLDESIQLLRDTVMQFAEQEVAPIAAEIDKTDHFPRHLWPKLGALGLLGITAEAEYGGVRMGYLANVIAMEELSRVSASVGLSYGVHTNLCINQITLNASSEQKQKYLPKLISGEHVGALAMSETTSGSDIMSMRLTAQDQGSHYVFNGNKMWITNGPEADIIIVYAKVQPSEDERKVTAFIIEKTFPGFSTAQKLDKLGMRGSPTCELVFNQCIVPKANILGEVHHGTKVLMRGLDYERVMLSAGPVGIMQACLDLVIPYVHERKQFGKPIGEFQLMQGKVADMYTTLNACRSYLYAVAQAADRGEVVRKDAAGVILFCAEAATQVALQTIQSLGGNGYINEFPAGRYLRDAKLYEIGAGTSEIRRMLIGRELFNETK